MSAKGKTEDYLQASGIPYTIIAPNAFMEISLVGFVGTPAVMGQTVMIVGEGRRKHSFISMNDVATFILATIDNPSAINQRLLLGGPEVLSFRDVVAIYKRVLEREVANNRFFATLVAHIRQAGLPDIRFHDLRHSAATFVKKCTTTKSPKPLVDRLGTP